MDVNNTPYFLLRGPADFEQGSGHLQWNSDLQALTLAQNQDLRLPASDPAVALLAWQAAAPLALDSFNQIGRLSGDGSRVEFNSGRGYLTLQDSELRDVAAPQGRFTDMAFAAVAAGGRSGFGQPAGDGRLALPFSDGVNQHGLLLFHLARRWQTFCEWGNADGEDAASQMPLRAGVDAERRVWLISVNRLMLCVGEPLPLPYTPQPVRFEPEQANPHPLRRVWQQVLPEGLRALALCCDLQRLTSSATTAPAGRRSLSRPLSELADAPFRAHACPADLPFAVDLALASDASLPDHGRLAALLPRQADDAGFLQTRLPGVDPALGQRDQHRPGPLAARTLTDVVVGGAAFCRSADGQLRLSSRADPDFPKLIPRPRELHALRRPRFIWKASPCCTSWIPGKSIPNGIGCIWMPASRSVVKSGSRCGCSPANRRLGPSRSNSRCRCGIRCHRNYRSRPVLGRSGTRHQRSIRDFIATAGRPRAAVARPLFANFKSPLRGDGRQSPSLHAIRVYYPRFSYQEAYFPEFYRRNSVTTRLGPPARPMAPDVRERLLAAFEGILTPVKAVIAASEQLLHPDATPAGNLAWLAEAVGGQLPVHWPKAGSAVG